MLGRERPVDRLIGGFLDLDPAPVLSEASVLSVTRARQAKVQ